MQWIYDLQNFLFPIYCPVCNMPLYNRGEVICLQCETGLPFTSYTRESDNLVAQIFWGRVALEGATSLFRFEKGSRYQRLLHLLKYKGRKDIGVFLGKMLGHDILDTEFGEADLIVPVPLHPKKEKVRGYNQSEVIAEGISLITGIPVNSALLSRRVDTKSQTRKNRIERWENMKDVFQLNTLPEENTCILLIDDIITTGATIEACALLLKEKSGARVFAASLACA